MNKLPLFYEIFNENGYIPEAEYDRIFHENPDVDNSPERKGMQLNDMVTKRQRCLIIGKNLLQQHQQLRQENVIQSTQNHRQKKRKCGYCGILKSVELNWIKCKHSRCNINYCPICQENIAGHENVCGKRQRR